MAGILDTATRPEIKSNSFDLRTLLNTTNFSGNSNNTLFSKEKGFGTLGDLSPVNVQQGYLESRLKSVSGYDEFQQSRFFNPEFEDIDNIRAYATRQGKLEYARNMAIKGMGTAWNSFLDGWKQNGRNVEALVELNANKLFNTDPTNLRESEEDRYKYPTFGTGQLDDSWRRFNPFEMGKSDFYGEMIPQLGFTVGTMGQAIMENMLIAGITGGVGNIANAPKQAWTAARLGKGFANIWEAATGIKNLKTGLTTLSAIQKEKALASNLGNVFKTIANGYAVYNTAAAEASFEAGNNYNETYDRLFQEFVDEKGYEPYGEELNKIKSISEKTAMATFGWNLPVLTASNLIQFNNILKPFSSAEANVLSNLSLRLDKTGKIIEAPLTKWQKVFGKTKNVLKTIAEPLSEGLEESSQALISKSSAAYYENLADAANPNSAFWDAIEESLDYVRSKEGVDEFVGGLLGGAIFKGVGKISELTGIQKKLGFDTSKNIKNRREKAKEEALRILNITNAESIANYLQNPDNSNLLSQVYNSEMMFRSATLGDKLAYNDAKDQSIRDFIYAGLKTGQLNLKLSQLDLLTEMNDEQFVKQFNLQDSNPEKLSQKVAAKRTEVAEFTAKIKEKAYSIQQDYQVVEKTYKNPYEIGTKEYNAWEAAKRDRIFSKDIIDSDRKRADSLREKVATETQGRINTNIFDIILDKPLRQQYINTMNVYKNVEDKTPQIEKKLKELAIIEAIDKKLEKGNTDVSDLATMLDELISDSEVLYDIIDLPQAVDETKMLSLPSFSKEAASKKKSIVRDIADILELEARNKIGINAYNFLNRKGIDNLYTKHLKAQEELIKDIKQSAKNEKITEKGEETNPFNDLKLQIESKIKGSKVVVGKDGKVTVIKPTKKDPSKTYVTVYNSVEDFLKKAPEQELGIKPKTKGDDNITYDFDGDTPVYTTKDDDEVNSKGKSAKYVNEAGLTDTSKYSEQSAHDLNPLDPHYHRRKDLFLEKLIEGKLINPETKKPHNIKDVKVAIISPETNISSGNANLYFKETEKSKGLFENNSKELDTAPILFLFVKEEKGKLYPISVNGVVSKEPLSQNYEVEFENIVYSYGTTSTDAKFTYRPEGGSELRPSPNAKKDTVEKEYQTEKEKHRKRREQWLSSEKAIVESFVISSGHSNKDKEQGQVRNSVKAVGLTENKVNLDSIFIATTGADANGYVSVETKGRNKRKLALGRPYFIVKNEANEIIDYVHLDNRKFTDVEKQTIKESLIDIAKKVAQGKTFNNSLTYKFLNGILYLDRKYKKESSINLSVDKGNLKVKFSLENGKQKELSLTKESSIDSFNSEFDKWLDDRFMNILNPKETTDKSSTKEFISFTIKNGKLKEEPAWASYSDYLTSDRGDRKDIPLTVDMLTPQEVKESYEAAPDGSQNPFPTKRKQRYIVIGKERVNSDSGRKAPATSSKTGKQKFAEKLAALKSGKGTTKTETSTSTKKEAKTGKQKFAEKLAALKGGRKVEEVNDIKEEEEETPTEPQPEKKSKDKKSFLEKMADLKNQQPTEEDEDDVEEQTPSSPEISEEDPTKLTNRSPRKGGPKRRTKLFEKIPNYTPENINEIKEFFRKNLPQVDLQFVDNLIKLDDGGLAWGVFYDSTVKIFNEAISGTGYHEAFEVVFGGILSKKQQDSLLSEMRKRKGSFSNFATNNESISYSSATNSQLREEMAEEFMRYKLTGVAPADNRNFFQKLIDFLKSWLFNIDTLNDVFAKIGSGYYANKTLSPLSETRTSRFTNLSPVELSYFLKGFSYEMIDDIVSTTQSFNVFDESFNEKEVYDNLFEIAERYYGNIVTDENGKVFVTSDANDDRTFKNYIFSEAAWAIEDIENDSDFSDVEKAYMINNIKLKANQEVLKKAEIWNNKIKPQWNEFIIEHKKYLKQLGIITTVGEDASEIEQEETNSNEYTRDAFKINVKQTAPNSIRLLFNTIASSVFDMNTIENYISDKPAFPITTNKINDYSGLSELYPESKQLFNIVMTNLSSSLSLNQMKEKLENLLNMKELESILDDDERANKINEMSKNNSIYVHLFKLYERVFSKSDSELSENDRALRLKFLSTFQKQKPTFYFMNVTEDGNIFLLDGARDSDRKVLTRIWSKAFTNSLKKKDNVMKLLTYSRKTFALSKTNKQYLDSILSIDNREEFIKTASFALKITPSQDSFIDNAFLELLTLDEREKLAENLRAILEQGIGKVSTEKGKKIFSKLSPDKLKVSSRYNAIADLIISKKGDDTEQVHTNIEGEQQQNVVQNNTVSTILSEILNSKSPNPETESDLEFFRRTHPWFTDSYLNNSLIFNSLYDENGMRTEFSPKVVVVEGTLNNAKGKKSSSQSLSERLHQEFNSNLAGIHYILVPADSETEWAFQSENKITFSDNIIEREANLDIFKGYLEDEIEFIKDFKNPDSIKRLDDRLNSTARVFKTDAIVDKDGNPIVRKIGESLQIFKDVLPETLVHSIHNAIDTNVETSDILKAFDEDISNALQEYFINRVNETFKELNRAFIVDVVNPKTESSKFPNEIENLESGYYFHGLLSDFVENNFATSKVSKIKINNKDVNLKNTVQLDADELFNVIAYRELNYMINNIEMTKLFFGNPAMYKDILKRVKSGLSPKQNSAIEVSYDDWFNQNKNSVVKGDKSIALESSDLLYHEHKPYVNTWVFRDHQTFNELGKLYTKYNENNAVDAQSYMTPQSYREFYWKNGASFRKKQEEAYQVIMALDRRLMVEDGVYTYPSQELKNLDDEILKDWVNDKNQLIKDFPEDGKFEIFKPLGMGSLYENEQLPFIWKTSVAMMTYQMVRGTNMQDAYVQMLQNKVDVLTFESAFKVGLKKDAKTNKIESLLDLENFKTLGRVKQNLSGFVHKLPFNYIGRQVETSTQKNKGVIGTQTTKLILTDLFEYGVPTDFMSKSSNYGNKIIKWESLSEQEKLNSSKHYRLEKEHRRVIEALENKGYYDLLDRLGLKEEKDEKGRVIGYERYDVQKVYNLLLEEMVKRGLSPNMYEILESEGIESKPIEAMSNYAQASFIILSIVRKQIIKPKLNGGQKIQMSSALLNNVRKEKLDLYYNNGDKANPDWKKLETEEEFNSLSSEKKATLTVTSNQLKFYRQENGETKSMEVMVSYSNYKKVQEYREKKGLPPISKEELLVYMNTHQKELVKAIGFRIPTQALSSIDTFIIKGFLPEYMGDAIAVPSELTTKAGSDFDVDKLNTYFNNFTINKKGYPVYITPDLEESEEATNRRWNKYSSAKRLLDRIDESISELKQRAIIEDRTAEILMAGIAGEIDEEEKIEDLLEEIDANNNYDEVIERVLEGNELTLQDYIYLKNRVENMLSEEEFKKLPLELQVSRKALENKYFSTIDEILKLPRNFSKLLSPNNSDEFSEDGGIRDMINTLKIQREGKTEEEIQKELENQKQLKKQKYVNHSQIIDSNYMRYQRWAFVAGKKGVGIAALSSTNHVNSQKIGFALNKGVSKYDIAFNSSNESIPFGVNLPHNEIVINGESVSALSGVQKINGDNIAEFVSKYVNGYVDISKDTWILEMGASLDVAGIYLLMERMGISSDKIALFMNQPVIRQFIQIKGLRNSPIKNINPNLKETLKNIPYGDDGIFQFISKELFGKEIPKEANLAPSKIFSTSSMKKYIALRQAYPSLLSYIKSGELTDAEKIEQYHMLKQFMIFKDYSDYIRASQSASNHDTFNLNSLSQLDVKDDTLSSLNQKGQLVVRIKDGVGMADALREDTFIGNIVNKLESLDKNFLSSHLFKIQNKAVRVSFLESVKKLISGYDYKSENDKRDYVSKINQVAINLLNSLTAFKVGDGNEKIYLYEMYNQLKFDILNNVLNNVKAAIKEDDDLISLNDNKWIKYLEITRPDESSDYAYFSISEKGKVGRNDQFEQKIWIDDFEKLYSNKLTNKLARGIILSNMVASGAEFNRENISDLIHWSRYFTRFTEALDNVKELSNVNIAREVARLKAYDEDIVPSLQYFGKNMAGQSPIYYSPNSKGEYKLRMDFTFRGQGSSEILLPYSKGVMDTILLLPEGSFDTRNNYFTIKQPAHGYEMEDVIEMSKNGDFSWMTRILFEKTGDKVKNKKGETFEVFVPIQIKGDRYFQELSPFNTSILNKNQKVNPNLIDRNYYGKILNAVMGSNQISVIEPTSSDTTDEAVSLTGNEGGAKIISINRNKKKQEEEVVDEPNEFFDADEDLPPIDPIC